MTTTTATPTYANEDMGGDVSTFELARVACTLGVQPSELLHLAEAYRAGLILLPQPDALDQADMEAIERRRVARFGSEPRGYRSGAGRYATPARQQRGGFAAARPLHHARYPWRNRPTRRRTWGHDSKQRSQADVARPPSGAHQ